MAHAQSLQRVWMNLSALPLVLGVQGLVRMCRSPKAWQALANALKTEAGQLSLITRKPSTTCSLNLKSC